jgi:hypothetical protein
MTRAAAMRVMLGRKWGAAAYTTGQESVDRESRFACAKSETPVTLEGDGGWLY